MQTQHSNKRIVSLWFMLALFTLAPLIAEAQKIPDSKRAQKARTNTLPALQKEFDEKGLTLGSPIFIRIFKKSDELELWVKKGNTFQLFKTYTICYYSGGLGTKTKQGDRMAPEGFYTVAPWQMNPGSSYHLSFDIGYPNAYERAKGYTGSAICVHGNCVSIGCFAMTDARIEEIFTIMYKAFEGKQNTIAVHSFPFRMTEKNMKKYEDSKWIDFWKNLKEGYDFFENSKTLPTVKVKNKTYTFE